MTYFELKKYISEKLVATSGELSDYEALLFIERLCGVSRAGLLMRMHDEAHFDEKLLENMLARRTKGEPAEYILGETVFFDLRIALTRDCLIPRADTEFVCEKALSLLPENARAADLCTGSGCIAIVLAKHGGAHVFACDISAGAIEKAKENAEVNGVSALTEFSVADVKSDVLNGKYDMIISNPPYIRTVDIAGLGESIGYEPYIALDDGSWDCDAEMSVGDVFELLEFDDPEEDDEFTNKLLGEWAYEQFAAIPTVGASFDYHGLHVTVGQMQHNRILRLNVRRLEGGAEQ